MIKKLLPILLFFITLVEFARAAEPAAIPRPEYPRPQFERNDWVNLNGSDWTFTFDFGKSGKERDLNQSTGFDRHITVPFCPESPLSGVGHTDFINAMWYHRTLDIPAQWTGKKVLLNFGGVDYRAEVYVNGKQLFTHFGGGASFSVDITSAVEPGKAADLVVYVQDDVRSGEQTLGKQSRRLNSYSCLYTRVTGIWQTVWLEAVNQGALKTCRITPDLDNSRFVFEPVFYQTNHDYKLTVKVLDNGKLVNKSEVAAANSSFIAATIKNAKTWSPESPFLYDIEFTITDPDGNLIDKVKSYAGMRKTELRDGMFYLNNKPYYQRLVLDQGYYPDGQWTAPTDSQLRRDIELAKEAGFNGARLHQKVFEPRYYYWADHLGYLTWGEIASWGMNWNDKAAGRNLLAEWLECVNRDYNVTSLIAWSPLNEVWVADVDGQRSRLTNDLYFLTKNIDRTRPVVSTSGGYHSGFTDIYAEHTYTQDPIALHKQLSLNNGKAYNFRPEHSAPHKGECYMIDEFGGIQWTKKMNTPEVAPEGKFWGYGEPPVTLDDYYSRLEQQVNVILSLDHIAGFCYTQIVDVELEKNGIYTYDRDKKFDMSRIKAIFSKDRAQAKTEVEQMLSKQTSK
ncbi:MAG: beta-glucuronidase [Muribaculum sp.]|nr:beta-glucuronidase [Muribaculaceae bacterium]MCM1080162.1 beta-glucuronidase [Muribaculum sp.]